MGDLEYSILDFAAARLYLLRAYESEVLLKTDV